MTALPLPTPVTSVTRSNFVWSPKHSLLFCCCLTVLIAIAYSPILQNQYVDYDDFKYVYDSRVVSGLTIEGVLASFTTSVDANWIPLTLLSLMIETSFFGTSPAATHLINLALHSINTLLLWLLLRRLTGSDIRAAVVSAIFALHPLRVESVAWAAERKDVLSAYFWLLTLHCYVSFVRSRNMFRYLLLTLLFGLGLMAKSMLVTLPVVLLLLDYWPLRRLDLSAGGSVPEKWKDLVMEKLPLLAMSIIISLITLMAQNSGGALNTNGGNLHFSNVTNAVVSLFMYVRQLLFPVNLAFFYPPVHWPAWQWGPALLFLTISTVWILRQQQLPYLTFGWLWYLVTMLPVIGLIRVGAHAHADRYTYIPLVGVTVMVVWGVGALCGNSLAGRRTAALLAGLAIGVCALLTFRQVHYWKDSMTLYDRALSVTDDNWLAHNNLAVLYIRSQQFTLAEEHVTESLRILPEYEEALLNLAHLLRIQRRFDEATAVLCQAVKNNPRSVKAIYKLGVHLISNGDLTGGEEMQQRLRPLDPLSAAALDSMLSLAARKP